MSHEGGAAEVVAHLMTRPLAAGIGLEVIGLDASKTIDEATQERLRQLFIEAGLLVFLNDTADSAEGHLSLSSVFGELVNHPLKEVRADGGLEMLVELSQRSLEGRPTSPVYLVDGLPRAAWQPWHADLYFTPEINRGGILRALEVPPEGGRTGFKDRIQLYELLPVRLKERIEDLAAVYRLQVFLNGQKYGNAKDVELISSPASNEQLQDHVDRGEYPPVVHPLVFIQPETGRKSLNLSLNYLKSIEGMDDEEGSDLLTELCEHCLTRGDTYFHQWSVNDLVLWDNWRMLHMGEGVDPQYSRRMQRTIIKGDYGLGRFLDDANRTQASVGAWSD